MDESFSEKYRLHIRYNNGNWKFEILRESDGAGIMCKDPSFESARKLFLSKLEKSLMPEEVT